MVGILCRPEHVKQRATIMPLMRKIAVLIDQLFQYHNNMGFTLELNNYVALYLYDQLLHVQEVSWRYIPW